ncbi:hypothetical protein [Kribbella sp. NPDC048915]|uniref:hypothetical protein n=1 Tax=Kribbella sp. NPDC048915 TaxID=3155148 RepID=UPI0033D2C6BF
MTTATPSSIAGSSRPSRRRNHLSKRRSPLSPTSLPTLRRTRLATLRPSLRAAVRRTLLTSTYRPGTRLSASGLSCTGLPRLRESLPVPAVWRCGLRLAGLRRALRAVLRPSRRSRMLPARLLRPALPRRRPLPTMLRRTGLV